VARACPTVSGTGRTSGGNSNQTTDPPMWRMTGLPSGSTRIRSKCTSASAA